MRLPTPHLETERLILRPFHDDDAGELCELQSSAEVLRYWDSPPWTDRASAERFLARSRQAAEEGTGARLVIEGSSDQQFLGWATFHSWNPDFRSAGLGYCLKETAWGKGYATEASRAVLQWAYGALDLNRVQSEVDTRNTASARVLEKLGFIHEGTLREECIVNGDVSDTWIYGLLKRDWRG